MSRAIVGRTTRYEEKNVAEAMAVRLGHVEIEMDVREVGVRIR